MRGQALLQKVSEVVRKEVAVALPAALRAVRHGARAAAKKFPEEYAKERKKL